MIINEILGVEPHPETDHTETVAANLTAVVQIRGHVLNDDPEEIFTYGLREEDTGVNSTLVREALQTWLDAGNTIDAYTTPAPTNTDVNIERDRRIAAGNTFTVTGYGDIPLTGTERDQIVFQAQLTRASAYAAAGETGEVMVIRDALNTTHMLTPTECIELISKGMTWIENVMMTSWHMKDATGDFTDGIPADYTNDKYW